MINEEPTTWDMPEETREQIIAKIRAIAWDIRGDWSDPRSECRKIVELCDKLNSIK